QVARRRRAELDSFSSRHHYEAPIRMKICTTCKSCYRDNVERCDKDGAALGVALDYGPLLAERYKLEKELGQSRLGTVYYGMEVQSNNVVFIRILPDKFFPNTEALEKFTRQLDVIAKIGSPYIVRVLDWGRLETEDIFVVTDFGKGGNLRDELK